MGFMLGTDIKCMTIHHEEAEHGRTVYFDAANSGPLLAVY